MGSFLSRSVEIQIYNKTRNITLRNPKTYSARGQRSAPPLPEVTPGSMDTCEFLGNYLYWGVAGILVYEATSFTLAIYFSNPSSHRGFCTELGLELSPNKVHLDSLEDTYARMDQGVYSSTCRDIQFARAVVDTSHGTTSVSHGPVKVMAIMSNANSSLLKVALEDQEEPGNGGGTETQSPGRHVQDIHGPGRHVQGTQYPGRHVQDIHGPGRHFQEK